MDAPQNSVGSYMFCSTLLQQGGLDNPNSKQTEGKT